MENLKTSEELSKILGECFKAAKVQKLTNISTLNIVYHIMDAYIGDKVKNKCPALVSFVDSMSHEKKKDIMDYLTEFFNDEAADYTTPLNDQLIDKERAYFSEEVSAAFDRAKTLTGAFCKSRMFEEVWSDLFLVTLVQGNKDLEPLIPVNDLMDRIKERETPKDYKDLMSMLMGIMGMGGNDDIDEGKDQSEDPNNKQVMDDEKFESSLGETEPISPKKLDPNSDTPVLDQFSEDMIELAKEGKYDPVIGRDDIIEEIIEVLCKRKKANVAIVGVAGSGKSTVVEGLAQRISQGNVPEKLKGKRLCSLNLNDLVAGTKYRGEYEERLQKIIKEVCSNKNIIIFIDELHNLVGNGGSAGNGDGANILKPYLARGEFQCIGSTTNEEYRRFIEKDAALNRRFTQIELSEPGREETIKILNGIKGKYEKFHHVKFSKEVIEACVDWSSRYIPEKFQPDKAIDILDLSGSLRGLKFLEQKIKESNLEDDKKKLDDLVKQRDDAVLKKNDFELGEKLDKEKSALEEEIKAKAQAFGEASVEIDDVAEAISKVSKIPVDKIAKTDQEKIALMKKELEQKVIGQDTAINTLVKVIQRNVLGLRNEKKPLASILAVGPSGVGKTLICEELARIFFGSVNNLIKFNGGEFKEEHSVSKLIGAPAGYVGYEDEPLFLQVKRKRQAVVLFDEVEKMHPQIMDILLNITDKGECNMANGEVVDFTNCIVIFTGNIGTKELANNRPLGFSKPEEEEQKEIDSDIVMKAVRKYFRPEFINRLSKVVVFNSLGKKEMDKIFTIELDKIKKQLSKKKISIQVSKKVRTYVIDKCDPNYGARDLQRGIEQYIIDPVSEIMLQETDKMKFKVDMNKENEIIIS